MNALVGEHHIQSPDCLEISSQSKLMSHRRLQITVADIFSTEGGIQRWTQSTQVDNNDDDEEIGQGTRSIFVSLVFMLILVDDDDD